MASLIMMTIFAMEKVPYFPGIFAAVAVAALSQHIVTRAAEEEKRDDK
jgi:hypothetical protein